MHESAEDSDYNFFLSRSQNDYIILNEDDIQHRQSEFITKISTLLSIPRESACKLLQHYKWSVNNVQQEWFSDKEKVRRTVGILEKVIVKSTSFEEVTCGICLEDYSIDNLHDVACSHLYCKTCWKDYISKKIDDGPGCLVLRCPDPSCSAAVGQDIVEMLASQKDKEKYRHYLTRSYVEDSLKVKWCPAPDCKYAVEFIAGNGSYDVTCSCSYCFCWNCAEEAHGPIECEIVAKWVVKNSAESENLKWILDNSKACPKCKRPIEKNDGCMHITCPPPCNFEFCWSCLGEWSKHSERTGGYFECNRKKEYDEAQRKRKMAQYSPASYYRYHERWESNELSKQKALSDLQELLEKQHLRLIEVQSHPNSQLKFIREVWQLIVECRRVLKWMFAYGYYLTGTERTKNGFFEYLQSVEVDLEKLHQYAEEGRTNYMNSEHLLTDFGDIHTKLIRQTRVTSNCFDELVRHVCSYKKQKGKSNGTKLEKWKCKRCRYNQTFPYESRCHVCGMPVAHNNLLHNSFDL